MAKTSKKSANPEVPLHEFFVAGAAWQESLLQAYRGYLLVTQSILLAISLGFLASQISIQDTASKLFLFVPNTVVIVIAFTTLLVLSSAVNDRTKSVDWWQKRLLKYEQEFGGGLHFTSFRVQKEHGFKVPEIEAEQLTSDQIESLLRPDKPKARKAFGIFVPGFAFVWMIMAVCAILDLLR